MGVWGHDGSSKDNNEGQPGNGLLVDRCSGGVFLWGGSAGLRAAGVVIGVDGYSSRCA